MNKTVLLEAVFTLCCIFVLLALSANFMFIINTFSFLLYLTKKCEFKYTLQAQWHAKAGSKFPLL